MHERGFDIYNLYIVKQILNIWILHYIKNHPDPSQSCASPFGSADNIDLGMNNSCHHDQPHQVIGNYTLPQNIFAQ